jgi:hypothetical protein
MKTLNITKGEWKADRDNVYSIQPKITADIICESPKKEYHSYSFWDDNSKLISDAGTTYNTTPILPSELLKQRNELLEALKVIQKQFNKDGNLTGYFYEICETAIKNATNA